MNAQNVLSSISSDMVLWLAQYHAEGKIEGMAEGIKNLAALLKSSISLDEAMKKLGQTV